MPNTNMTLRQSQQVYNSNTDGMFNSLQIPNQSKITPISNSESFQDSTNSLVQQRRFKELRVRTNVSIKPQSYSATNTMMNSGFKITVNKLDKSVSSCSSLSSLSGISEFTTDKRKSELNGSPKALSLPQSPQFRKQNTQFKFNINPSQPKSLRARLLSAHPKVREQIQLKFSQKQMSKKQMKKLEKLKQLQVLNIIKDKYELIKREAKEEQDRLLLNAIGIGAKDNIDDPPKKSKRLNLAKSELNFVRLSNKHQDRRDSQIKQAKQIQESQSMKSLTKEQREKLLQEKSKEATQVYLNSPNKVNQKHKSLKMGTQSSLQVDLIRANFIVAQCKDSQEAKMIKQVDNKCDKIKLLIKNTQKLNSWITDYEPWIDKKQDNKGQIFKNAIIAINEWTEQMEIGDEMIKVFIDDEVKQQGKLDEQILQDALMVKMSGILSSSKKQRRMKTLHQGQLQRQNFVDKIIRQNRLDELL
eukprot:403347060